jgi:hypothetical protein
MIKLGWYCINYDDLIDNNLENLGISIKNCLVFKNVYEIYYTNKEFIIKNNIRFIIYENDLHLLNHRIKNNNKNINFHNNEIQIYNNLYTCASYWYCYNKFWPNISKNKIIPYETFIYDDFTSVINNNPINCILLSGSCTAVYPARLKLIQISKNNSSIHRLKNVYNIFNKII